MTFARNVRYLFTAIPQDYPEEGQHTRYDDSQTIDIENEPLDGGVLVKNLVASLNPYLRTMMRDASIEAYVPAYPLGGPSNSHGVGVIVRSEHEDYKPRRANILPALVSLLLKIPVNDSLPDSLYLGVLGLPGQTAWMSWKDLSHAQKGQTVFISSAAGAVGSVVVQLAKRDGLKVIASSGSDEKVHFTRDCGADVSFNYKTERTEDILKEHGPIDIYYDNVGGETLDLSLKYASNKARFIICGQIAGLNEGRKTYAFQNMFEIVAKEIHFHGFLWTSLRQRYHDHCFEEMPRLVGEGKIKYKEDRSYGLDKIDEAFLEVYSGANRGKKVVVLAEE